MQKWVSEKFSALGHCVYCGSTQELSNEHIIPFGLLPKGGDWFLPKSSCKICAEVTAKFEQLVLQGAFGAIRYQMDLKSRRPPKHITVTTKTYRLSGEIEQIKIPTKDMPATCLGFRWATPGILSGQRPTTQFAGELVMRFAEKDSDKLSGDVALKIGRFQQLGYARMLAKIAHVYAVAKLGEAAFRPYLKELILGTSDIASHFVGGDHSPMPLKDQPETLHDIFPVTIRAVNVEYWAIAIRLFACLRMPRYIVVVGNKTAESKSSMPVGPTYAQNL